MNIADLTRNDKSVLLYAETTVVDYGGLLEGNKLNADDIASLKQLKEEGVLDFGRIPFRALGAAASRQNRQVTHWVTFHDDAWQLAHALRRERSTKSSATRTMVDECLAEKNAT